LETLLKPNKISKYHNATFFTRTKAPTTSSTPPPSRLTGLHVLEQAALGQAALQGGGERHGDRRRKRNLREAGTGNAETEVRG